MVLLAGIVGYIAYTGNVVDAIGVQGLSARQEQVVATRDTIARLDAATDSAKKELARGTVEDLRKRLDTYRGSLALLRRLVPERNEVPNLLDDISSRSKIRGVTLSQVVPLRGGRPGAVRHVQVQHVRHRALRRDRRVHGRRGEPPAHHRAVRGLSVTPAAAGAAKALNDTSGALLEAKFQIRTYVKTSAAGEASGT